LDEEKFRKRAERLNDELKRGRRKAEAWHAAMDFYHGSMLAVSIGIVGYAIMQDNLCVALGTSMMAIYFFRQL